MTATDEVADHTALLRELKAAGFRVAGFRRSEHARLAWPDGDGTLMVSLDETAPEHGGLLAAVVAELERAAARGRVAQQVLDGLDEPGMGLR